MNKVINDKLEYSKPVIGIVSAKVEAILQTGSGQHNPINQGGVISNAKKIEFEEFDENDDEELESDLWKY
ncbi:hypothetical protein J5A71_08935 [Prevotella melaninogenica]|uniref:hypothetical protein n=1 Tax=Prevotella melaninogenica TaxID=28132 RepID=UPI001BA76C98|nr:hypothetical protein [Prevotella melaninogenica]QUB57404.1 hypothetical protein J5A72_08295 [Prevotella melaninogenica]QUB59782.1 hypothetical protein J5A71_08935 [Prevotella melaninogenica]